MIYYDKSPNKVIRDYWKNQIIYHRHTHTAEHTAPIQLSLSPPKKIIIRPARTVECGAEHYTEPQKVTP